MIAVLFALVIVTVLGKTVINNLDDHGMFERSSVAQSIIDETQGSTYKALDNLFLGAFIAGFLFLGVLSFQEPVRTNRAFFPIAILIVLPIMLLISSVLSNAYDKFGDNAEWASAEADNGTIATTIMSDLPFYVFGVMALLLFVVFGINRGEGS